MVRCKEFSPAVRLKTPEGTVPEGTVPEGTVPEGTVPEGTVPEGTVPDGEELPKTEKEIFYTLKEALEFALPFAVEEGHIANHKAIPDFSDGLDILPAEVNGPWKMTKSVIETSLQYIYESIYHTCYMMCVKDGTPVLKKLEPNGIPKFFKKAIAAKEAESPDMFRVLQGKDPRVMQCVIKARSDKESVSKEYMEFVNKFPLTLPDGVYILNLTDAVLYRKDGNLPWKPMGPEKSLEDSIPFLPVLGGSGAKGYWDIPMPNYDDLALVTSSLPNYETKWKEKKAVAVFRGGPTGCGTNAVTNMRIKLAGMRREDLDVGLVRDKSNNPRYNFKRGGIFMMDLGGVPTVPFMNMKDQSKHKYVIHIDGNVAAYRLLNTMLMGSVVLKVEGPYTLWVDHLLRDKENYISVKEDLSNLDEVMAWCKENDEQCKRIAAAGRKFALKILTRKYVTESFAKLVWGIVDKSISTPVSTASSSTPTPPPAPPLGKVSGNAKNLVAAAAAKFAEPEPSTTTIPPPPSSQAKPTRLELIRARIAAEAAAKKAAIAPPPPAAVAPPPPETVAPPPPAAVAPPPRLAALKAKIAAEAAAAAKKGGRRTRRMMYRRRRYTRKA